MTIDSVDLVDANGLSTRALRSNSPARLRIAFEVRSPLPSMTAGFLIRDRLGNDVFGTNTYHLDSASCPLEVGRRFECEFDIGRMSLGAGNYNIAIALHQAESHVASNHD